MPPYLYERQTEYWTSRAIEDYFLDAGFQIVTFPISQIHERDLPADFVFCHPGTKKIFGIQYKTLYNEDGDHWTLDEHQHRDLQLYSDWIFYGLSEMKVAQEHRTALHKTIFVSVKREFQARIDAKNLPETVGLYYRWGGFVKNLEKCPIGLKVESADEIRNAIRRTIRNEIPELDINLVDVFVTNLEASRVIHYSTGDWQAQ